MSEIDHIENKIGVVCDAVATEIDADCRISDWRVGGSIIEVQFTVGMKYGQTRWRKPIYLEQAIDIWPPDDITARAEMSYVSYQAVRIVAPIFHPIQRDFWSALKDQLITHYLEYNNEAFD